MNFEIAYIFLFCSKCSSKRLSSKEVSRRTCLSGKLDAELQLNASRELCTFLALLIHSILHRNFSVSSLLQNRIEIGALLEHWISFAIGRFCTSLEFETENKF